MASQKKFTRKEIESRNTKDDAVFIIDNVVYNVTQFLEDHPGGHEVLLLNAGKDASQCFLDVGHTPEAREIRKQYKIGEVVDEDVWEVVKRKVLEGEDMPMSVSGLLSVMLPPVAMALAATFVYVYFLS